jgi:Na+/melibiose symporter-like transporter
MDAVIGAIVLAAFMLMASGAIWIVPALAIGALMLGATRRTRTGRWSHWLTAGLVLLALSGALLWLGLEMAHGMRGAITG